MTDTGSRLDDPRVAEILRSLLAAHVEAHYRQDADAATALYAEEFKFIAPGLETTSRAAQRDAYAAMYQTLRIKALEYVSTDMRVCGTVAHEIGYLNLTTDSGGTLESSRWRYLFVWEQHAGLWKMTRGAAFPAEGPAH